jgi:hypothetical protein
MTVAAGDHPQRHLRSQRGRTNLGLGQQVGRGPGHAPACRIRLRGGQQVSNLIKLVFFITGEDFK